jgi:hypothetical protein
MFRELLALIADQITDDYIRRVLLLNPATFRAQSAQIQIETICYQRCF